MKKFLALSILMIALYGCSSDSIFEGTADDSGIEALLEDAAEALDDGNYSLVVAALSSYYNTSSINPDVARLLASGYMGMAGIDVTNLIAYSNNDPYYAPDEPFDMVEATLSLSEAPLNDDEIECDSDLWRVLIFEDSAPYAVFIDGHCIQDLVDDLDYAKRIFDKLQDARLATYDDYVQHGIASAVHYVLFVGNVAAVALNPYSLGHLKYEAGSVPAPINTAAYQFYKYEDQDYWQEKLIDQAGVFSEEVDENGWTPYQRDLIDVNNAVDAISHVTIKQNSIQDSLDDFLREILILPEGDITNTGIISTMDTAGIITYISLMSSGG